MDAAAHSGRIALVAGGLVLMGSPLIDFSNPAGYQLLVVGFALGFAGLVYASVRLTRGFSSAERAAFMFATITWALGWSWQFHLGLVFYIPNWFWGTAASAAFILAVVASVKDGSVVRLVSFAFLAVGSISSTAIALANPVFSPQHLYTPLAGSAVIAGLLLLGGGLSSSISSDAVPHETQVGPGVN